MKNVYVLLLIFCVSLAVYAQKANPNYDDNLAKKLGADDYGMKTYTLVILKSGTNNSGDKDARDQAFEGHMKNINALVEQGKLIVAGPIDTNENNYRGLFILTEPDIEKAKVLIKSDPAVAQNYLDADVYTWYGSAALSEYLPASDKIWKVGF